MLFAITAQEFTESGEAWVKAFAVVLTAGIAQIGIIFLAAIAVYQNIRKQLPSEFTARLDRYNDRLDRVANMTVASAPEEKKMEVAAAVARTPVPSEVPSGAKIVITQQPEVEVVSETKPSTEEPKP